MKIDVTVDKVRFRMLGIGDCFIDSNGYAYIKTDKTGEVPKNKNAVNLGSGRTFYFGEEELVEYRDLMVTESTV